MPCLSCGNESYRTCGCDKPVCYVDEILGLERSVNYPDCNGLYPHSITKEGCVYCNQKTEFMDYLSQPADVIDSIDMKACTERMFDLESGGVNYVVTGLREEQEYQPGPWYCELIYKFYHWCQDWLDDLETWAIAKENKARKKQREQNNK